MEATREQLFFLSHLERWEDKNLSVCVCEREHVFVCVCVRVLHASHQREGFGVDAVGLSNLIGWTTRDAGHTVCASIVSTDHVDHRTPWKQEVITSYVHLLLIKLCSLSVCSVKLKQY